MIASICFAFSATSVCARTTENNVPEETVMIAYPDRPYQFLAYVQSAPSEIRSSDDSVVSAREEKADGIYEKWMICLQAKKKARQQYP